MALLSARSPTPRSLAHPLASSAGSPEIRKITITGGASVLNVQEERSAAQPRRSTTRRRRMADETFEAGSTPSTITKITVDTGVVAPQVQPQPQQPQKGGAAPTAAAANQEVKRIQIVQIQEPAVAPADPPGKVVLGGKKPKQMKVVLTKKNHGSGAAAAAAAPAPEPKPRKVTLGLQHLKRRVTKARRLQRALKAAPIDQIRSHLIAAKIIKPDSKAPESILRQMYSDAKLVSTKSL